MALRTIEAETVKANDLLSESMARRWFRSSSGYDTNKIYQTSFPVFEARDEKYGRGNSQYPTLNLSI